MAITQIIATLPAVLNDSATFYEDIAERNNSLVTTILPSINAWATQANTTQTEINAKALQVAAQAVDGGYSQTYINTNFVGVNNAQNITGIKTFSVSPIVPTPTTSGNVITMDNIIQKTAVGIGYGTGASGTVSQFPSKSTSVTLNKPCGRIITSSESMVNGQIVYFSVLNSIVSELDTVEVNTVYVSGLGSRYRVRAIVTVGSFVVEIENISGGTNAENVYLNFTITKGANS